MPLSPDMDLALDALRAVSADPNTVHSVSVPGAPPSKARARFGKAQVYVDRKSRAAEEALAWTLKEVVKRPYERNVAVACIFFRPNRQRIDADNMLKFVLDAANGVCWKDDSQVTAVLGRVELDAANPRTVIAMADHESSMLRGRAAWVDCAECGKPFDAKGQPHKYCSPACRKEGRKIADLSAPVPCRFCGTPFKRHTSGTALCSTECRVAELRDRRRAQAHGNTCADCGTSLAKSTAVRCRPCWRANVAKTAA